MLHTGKFYIKITNELKSKISSDAGMQILDLNKPDFEGKYMEEINIICSSVFTKHHGIKSKFKQQYNGLYLYIFVDFVELINNPNIRESDYSTIESKINNYLMELLGTIEVDLVLNRLDYRYDAIVSNKKERLMLINAYKKTFKKYGMKYLEEYPTGIKFKSKSIETMVYDKEQEKKDKYVYLSIKDYEQKVLRLEVSLRNNHLNYQKYHYGLSKCLFNYLNEDSFKYYMKKHSEFFTFKGDYYKIQEVKKILNSSSLKSKDKELVRTFLIKVAKSTLFDVINSEEYSRYYINKCKNILNDLGINPILIPKNSPYPSKVKNPYANIY